jgi:hypothetical protein
VCCCQVEVSASGCSFVQRSPTEGDVSECDREALAIRRPRPNRTLEPSKKNYVNTKFRLLSKVNNSG